MFNGLQQTYVPGYSPTAVTTIHKVRLPLKITTINEV